eukprot:CAMPEP_0117447082 /NCGR_PEP_ID=MMETSP0759-20121206/6682_1 /TAXON_ID=63605 /ORGANISM="Percolomonas cosmopolitus, Strain WS" /LENGTH=605 /DNA_ID=CAMNT_0005239387 /DNA_START=185 /DNA_END=1999 /DNA_ORIENTATION=+
MNFSRILGKKSHHRSLYATSNSSNCTNSSIGRSPLSHCQFRSYAGAESLTFSNNVALTTQYGHDILHDPLLNKGTSFSLTERDRLGLRGLLPPNVKDLNTQLHRIRYRYDKLDNDIDRYIFMQQLQDTNETLFYKFLVTYIDELAPIVYTPTVGKACVNFTHYFRRPRGMFFSMRDKGEMKAMVHNFPSQEVDLVVITDGGRILGLGDLGCNGMPIAIGKLSLYVAGAGMHPGRVLPIQIDVGTDNEQLIKDPLYLGIPQKRLQGIEYYEIVDEVLEAVTSRWPNVLIQFEDMTPDKANVLLNKYRNQFLCFNDDIQGTGTVIVSGILNAMRVTGQKFSDIANQRILIAGAGCAGVGVADALQKTMVREGITDREAFQRFYLCDKDGLITSKREKITPDQAPYAAVRTDCEEGLSILETIKKVKPTILLGVSGIGGLFTKDIVEAMAECNTKPIIFPLSNPTDNCECTAEDAYKWTNGNVVFASGSPFPPVRFNQKTFLNSQANNMFVFPGLGMGAVLAGANSVTNGMLYAASVALANNVSTDALSEGLVYPRVREIRNASISVAMAVIKEAIAEDNFTLRKLKFMDDAQLRRYIEKRMYYPEYQ